MPWSTRTPEQNAKYASREHRAYLTALKADLTRDGYLICTADDCLMPTRVITNPRGRESDGLTAGHEPDGIHYRGPQHRRCNNNDATVRGNKSAKRKKKRWVF